MLRGAAKIWSGNNIQSARENNLVPKPHYSAAYAFRAMWLEPGGGGGTLGISGWGCAAGTLEPLTYTTASSAEFCYPVLE